MRLLTRCYVCIYGEYLRVEAEAPTERHELSGGEPLAPMHSWPAVWRLQRPGQAHALAARASDSVLTLRGRAARLCLFRMENVGVR
jgi:hypothetical protein